MSTRLRPTEAQLLDIARDLLARGETLSVAAVATAAGVSRGTIYKRFPDQAALLGALLETGRITAPPSEPDTRRRILDAVGQLLKQEGLSGITLERVAREAGVGEATIYRHFGDRRGLLKTFAAECTPRRLIADLPLDGSGDRDADLLRLTRESLSFLREYRAFAMLLFSTDPEVQAIFAEARAGSMSVRELTHTFLNAHFPDPTGRIAAIFQGALLFVAWSTAGDLEEDARFIVHIFLHGVSQ